MYLILYSKTVYIVFFFVYVLNTQLNKQFRMRNIDNWEEPNLTKITDFMTLLRGETPYARKQFVQERKLQKNSVIAHEKQLDKSASTPTTSVRRSKRARHSDS